VDEKYHDALVCKWCLQGFIYRCQRHQVHTVLNILSGKFIQQRYGKKLLQFLNSSIIPCANIVRTLFQPSHKIPLLLFRQTGFFASFQNVIFNVPENLSSKLYYF